VYKTWFTAICLVLSAFITLLHSQYVVGSWSDVIIWYAVLAKTDRDRSACCLKLMSMSFVAYSEKQNRISCITQSRFRQIFRIGTVRYAEGLWRMRRHGPVIAHCTDSEDFPRFLVPCFFLFVTMSVGLYPKTCGCVFCELLGGWSRPWFKKLLSIFGHFSMWSGFGYHFV